MDLVVYHVKYHSCITINALLAAQQDISVIQLADHVLNVQMVVQLVADYHPISVPYA